MKFDIQRDLFNIGVHLHKYGDTREEDLETLKG